MPETNNEVKLTEDLLRDYSGAKTEWAKQAAEDSEFRAGVQWTKTQVETLKSRNQAPVVVNVIHSAVEQAKALLTTNKPRFQATGREDSDVKTGRVLSDLMEYIWDTSNGNTVLKQTIDDYYVKGMGCIMAYPDMNGDFGKGEVCLKSVDPMDVYIDPSSRDPFCQDANHIIIAKKTMQSQLLLKYPDYEEQIKKADQTSVLSNYPTSRDNSEYNQQVGPYNKGTTMNARDEDRELEVMERFTKVKMPMIRVYDPYEPRERVLSEEQFQEYLQNPAFVVHKRGLEPIYVTAKQEVEKTKQMYDQFNGEFHEFMDPATQQIVQLPGEERAGSIPNSTTRLIPITIKDLVEDKMIQLTQIKCDRVRCIISVGDQLIVDYMKPISVYPLVTLMNHHDRNPFPQSDVRLVKGLQEYVNKIRSLIIAHASSSTNVKLLIPRGSMDKKNLEEEWGRAGTAVIEFDPELGQPIVAGPVPLPNELYNNEREAKSDIERILGIYALMQGDQGSAPTTYKGTIALDEFGQRRIRSKKDDIEAMLNQLGLLVIEMIQWIYTDEKTFRIIQPNRGPKDVKVNELVFDDLTNAILGRINDITVGRYDVQVVSGSTLPSNRWARFEYYKELYSLGVIDQVELLKQTDVADMEGVLERAGQMQKMQSQMENAEKEIKKLKGDLQTAQRESLHDRKRVELKDFEVKLAKLEADMKAASQLYKHRTNDHLKQIKDEVDVIVKEVDSPQRVMNEELLGIDDE
ncbi:MAG: hypothetical protein CMD28_02180 [Flavobacteriales bacterium]|nr:hypothetical protein [Flavobacteriales bacterium]